MNVSLFRGKGEKWTRSDTYDTTLKGAKISVTGMIQFMYWGRTIVPLGSRVTAARAVKLKSSFLILLDCLQISVFIRPRLSLPENKKRNVNCKLFFIQFQKINIYVCETKEIQYCNRYWIWHLKWHLDKTRIISVCVFRGSGIRHPCSVMSLV